MVKLTKRNQQQNNALPELMCLHYKENEMNVVYSFNFVFTSQMEEWKHIGSKCYWIKK